ncbi:hypothetical protein N7471_003228 [Penicillium samsonianum]|uniref:uncharacterized protein n=1 Tax=Penicillium samsonianum TaxID=1882272 RepID=UPI0025485EF5|nr:uncharacterized protein N7471_003228 [Penicillium samsonianum]KAJ6143775.1 hypothetical protein N7471_003228 [Penicillium samsonianum]
MKTTIFITSIFAALAVASETLHPAEQRGVDIGNDFAQRWLEQGGKTIEKRCNNDDFALCIAGCQTGCAGCLPGCGGSCIAICHRLADKEIVEGFPMTVNGFRN